MNKLYYCVMVSLLVVPEPATFTMCGLLALALIQQGCHSALLAFTSVDTTSAGEPAGGRAVAAAMPATAAGSELVGAVPREVNQPLPDHVEAGSRVDLRSAGRIRDGRRLRIPFAESPAVG